MIGVGWQWIGQPKPQKFDPKPSSTRLKTLRASISSLSARQQCSKFDAHHSTASDNLTLNVHLLVFVNVDRAAV